MQGCYYVLLRIMLSIMSIIFVLSVAAPCVPYNIQAQMDILSSKAVLSWYLGAGALRYSAVAVSSLFGSSVSCDTNQTNCNLNNLICGDKYNITVNAVGSACNSSASMGQFLQTGDVYSLRLCLTYYR